jgi:hypothetical protein
MILHSVTRAVRSSLVLGVAFALALPSPWPMTTAATRIYLPAISRALDVAPSWSYVVICGGPLSTPQSSPAALPVGVRLLDSRFQIGGGTGLAWKAEWLLNGQLVPGLTGAGTIPTSGQVSMQVAANADTCKDPLPSGVYTVRLYIANSLRSVSTATLP